MRLVATAATVDGAGIFSASTGTFVLNGLTGSSYRIEIVSARTTFNYLNTITVGGALANRTFLGTPVQTPWGSATDGLAAGNWLDPDAILPVGGSITIMNVTANTLGILNAIRVVEIETIPEPATLLLFGSGLVACPDPPAQAVVCKIAHHAGLPRSQRERVEGRLDARWRWPRSPASRSRSRPDARWRAVRRHVSSWHGLARCRGVGLPDGAFRRRRLVELRGHQPRPRATDAKPDEYALVTTHEGKPATAIKVGDLYAGRRCGPRRCAVARHPSDAATLCAIAEDSSRPVRVAASSCR